MDDPGARPRVLLVTRNFPPLVGGMEKLNWHLLRSLSDAWRVAMVGPAGCKQHAPSGTIAVESPLRPLPVLLVRLMTGAIYLAWRIRPKLVIAGSGLAAPFAWIAARLVGAECAVYLHGLDIVAPSALYQRLWLPFLRACDIVWVNSQNTASLAESRGIASSRTEVLHPGTDIPELDVRSGDRFRSELGLHDQRVLLSVGRFTRRKGLAEFCARSLPTILAMSPQTVLLVVGGEATDALHGTTGSEQDRIMAAAAAAGVQHAVRFLGRLSDEQLASAYQATDCHVFPVLDVPGDVEGFGMVALESAAYGTPTVAFDVGGISDAVSRGISGTLIAAGQYEAFAQATLDVLAAGKTPERIAECRAFAMDKSWHAFGRRLRDRVGALSKAKVDSR